jgi:AcrR family transcriptional regulator
MARAVSEPLDGGDVRDRFVAAGLRTLQDDGAAELTVRRVAEVAGSSTMGIYTQFGGRAGMVEAIYRRGFELLRDRLAAATDDTEQATPGSEAALVAIAVAYRAFALANPALYALMFERPMPDFDPSPRLRADALGMTFSLLTAQVGLAQDRGLIVGDDPVRPSYLIWTTIHGITSIELTHAVRSPLPGWFVDSPEAGERVLIDGVRAVLAGLGRCRVSEVVGLRLP